MEKGMKLPKKDEDSDDEGDNWGKGLTEDEFNNNMKFFESHPMFMKDIPKDLESNPNVQALQSIVYDEADPRTQADRMNVIVHKVSKFQESWQPNDPERKREVLPERSLRKLQPGPRPGVQ